MSFYSDVLAKSPLFHTTKAVNDLGLLEPVTRAAVAAIIADAKAEGHDLRVLETYRSRERQAILYQRKATTLKTVGTHSFGIAADLGLYRLGTYIGDGSQYLFLGELARKHGMIWGGSWKSFPDYGHVQRCTLADQRRLFAGSWFPDASYSPYPATQLASK